MDTSSFRPGESHVAQQSRRDKLRVQASSASAAHHLDDFSNNLEQLSVHSGLNPDLVQVRNVRNASILYDPTTTVFSSEMLNFATRSTGVLPAQRHAMADQELAAMTHNMSHPVSSNIKANSSDPQACSNWRSSDTQQCYDWMVNYASGSSVGRENNQKPIFVGDVLSNNARVTDISTPTQYVKPIYDGYQSVQSSLAIPSSEIHGQGSQRQHREMQFASHMHPFYHNTLADVVTSASNAYGNHSTALCFDNANTWMNRPVESCHQWSSEMGLVTRKNSQELRTLARDPNTQVLSLSLSSNPPSRGNITQFEEGYESEHMQSKPGELKESHNQDSKILKSSNYLCSMSKPAIISRSAGKSLSDMVGTSNYNVLQNAGPLGPFTGYATILKSSKFLKPAQQLLDEFCRAAGLKLLKTCEGSARISGDCAETGAKVNNTTFYSSNEVSGDVAVAVASSTCESLRSEYQQKKAKLLYLQEEVCHRYKQYHQQMQMVASSFESVAGLSTATPYVSLALKTVSRNFRCVRHAISDQLKHVAKALGEDLLSPNTGTSSSKGDTSTSRLKYTDQNFQRYRCGGANAGFFESQQHVWRPQRGLPERSVAILRAWLFEHFLHPYPSDTDKHMLATQTGLSRNQAAKGLQKETMLDDGY
uniref:POX domain-containing protein n=1 Tax=Manihot esculenta TaxID=3983 RepID=A0A2C9W040_MANES